MLTDFGDESPAGPWLTWVKNIMWLSLDKDRAKMMFGMIMINRELKEIRLGWVVIKERGPLVSGGSCRSHMGGPCSSSKRMRPDCTVTRHTITNIQIQKYKYTWSSQSQGWSLLLQGDGTQLHSKTTTTLMQKFPHCPAATLHPPTHTH